MVRINQVKRGADSMEYEDEVNMMEEGRNKKANMKSADFQQGSFTTNIEGGPSYNKTRNIEKYVTNTVDHFLVKRFMASTAILSPFDGMSGTSGVIGDIEYSTFYIIPTNIFEFWFCRNTSTDPQYAISLIGGDYIRIKNCNIKLSHLQILEETQEVVSATEITTVEKDSNMFAFVWDTPGNLALPHYQYPNKAYDASNFADNNTVVAPSIDDVIKCRVTDKTNRSWLSNALEVKMWKVGDPPLEYNFSPINDEFVQVPVLSTTATHHMPQLGLAANSATVGNSTFEPNTSGNATTFYDKTRTMTPIKIGVPLIRNVGLTAKKYKMNMMIEMYVEYEKMSNVFQNYTTQQYLNNKRLVLDAITIPAEGINAAVMESPFPCIDNFHGIKPYVTG